MINISVLLALCVSSVITQATTENKLHFNSERQVSHPQEMMDGHKDANEGRSGSRINIPEVVSSHALCPVGFKTVCWTCRASKSEEQCLLRGHYEVCNDPEPTCEHLMRLNDDGSVREVMRQCRSKQQCISEGLGCKTYGPGLTYCRECTPLKRSLEYKCLPAENICKPHTMGVGTCMISSDPYLHYITFDGQRISANGTCKYQLSAPCPGSTLPYFAVHSRLLRSPNAKNDMSFVGYIEVELETNIIQLKRHGHVLLNGEEVALPATNLVNGFKIVRHSKEFIAVITEQGLAVLYDGIDKVILRLPEKFRGSTCGMCGDYNGDIHDDFRRKDGLDMSRIGLDAHAALLHSWQVEDAEAGEQCHIPDCGCDYGLCMPETGKCRCPPDRAGSRCQFKISRACIAMENMHLRTYDGAMLHITGTCKYLLTGTCPAYHGTWPPPFQLHVRTERAASMMNSILPRYIELTLGGHIIKLDRDQGILVDGEIRYAPVHEIAGVDIYMHAGHVLRIKTSFGLSVYFHKSGLLKIKLPGHYEDYLCGLCGNYNWVYWDDIRTSRGDYVGGPQYAASASSLVAASWLVKDINDESCLQPLRDAEVMNMMLDDEESITELTKTYCNAMINSSITDNPFAHCLKRMGNLSQLYYEACKVGVAESFSAGDPVIKANTCRLFEALASDCLDMTRQPMVDWRNRLSCPLKCPYLMKAKDDVKDYSRSCSNKGAMRVVNVETDIEGCSCENGYILDHNRCVRPSECGCHDHDGVYRRVGESWMARDCKVNYTCQVGGSITSQNYGCKADEICQTLDGIRKCLYDCKCKNGGTCIPGEKMCRCPWDYAGKYCQEKLSCCRSWGDFNIKDISQSKLTEAKECSHLLSGACKKENFPRFNISRITQVTPSNDEGIYYSNRLNVSFEGHDIIFYDDGNFLIDGMKKTLPVKLGSGILLRTSKSIDLTSEYLRLRVWHHTTEICIPKSYGRHMCGLCGDFSRDDTHLYNDEGDSGVLANLKAPGSKKVNRVVNWSGKWDDTSEHGRCSNLPDNNNAELPKLSPDQLEQIDSPEICGSIKPWEDRASRIGPFKDCMDAFGDDVVNVYYKTCVKQVSAILPDTTGLHSASCDVLQAFATACEEENHYVRWRQDTKCYPKCPLGQVYYEQMSSCLASCQNPSAPKTCKYPNTDGCGCPKGFLLKSETCVTAATCGCVDDKGQYHEPGSTWLTDNCTSSMTCKPSRDGSLAIIVKGPGCNQLSEICSLEDTAYICSPLKVNGSWGRWTKWSGCNVLPYEPDTFVRMRTRQCNAPEPINGGEQCHGPAVEMDTETCTSKS